MKADWKNMPLFKKAMKIEALVAQLVDVVETTDISFEKPIQAKMIAHNLEYLRKNAILIPSKIAGAASSDTPYDIQMENAAFIRCAARELLRDARGLQLHGYQDIEYLDLLRQEVEAFRVLFAEWVKTFDPWNYSIDRWGLFNPPGINYDDHDPDEDMPYNSDDLEDF